MNAEQLTQHCDQCRLEIARIDREIEAFKKARRSGQGFGSANSGLLGQLKSRRAALVEDVAEVEEELQDILRDYASPTALASRASGRKLLADVRASFVERDATCTRLDQAGQAFVAALSDLAQHADATRSLISQALRAAVTQQGDAGAQQRLRLGEFALDATEQDGVFTGFAVVLFLNQVLQRFRRPHYIAQTAPGWQYLATEQPNFLAASRAQSEQIDRYLGGMDRALSEDNPPLEAQRKYEDITA